MTDDTFSDADAQAIRVQWFRFLDTIEPVRSSLHTYCMSLTRNIWDAEDLLQETLLRGFAAAARGDLHGEASQVRDARAYLFRVATNSWIDVQRKAVREIYCTVEELAVEDPEQEELVQAIEKAVALSSPQEFAALILKEGYDFTTQEIADFIGTTPGTVKSALSRGRRKMEHKVDFRHVSQVNQKLAQAFADAINDGDLNRVKELMSESLTIVVCNVGGGRGRDGVWAEKTVPGAAASYAECEGEHLVVLRHRNSGIPYDIVRIEGTDGVITKITDYCYALETLSLAARALEIPMETIGYHQPPETIRQMVQSTRLPWESF